MAKGKSWYIHTIDDRPAVFDERDGTISFANRRSNLSILVPDLDTIRQQQARNRAWWRQHGFHGDRGREGYISFPR